MCGIAGFAGDGTETDLQTMCAALRHRGPDGHAIHIDRRFRVGLGHERLVVIDPTGGGQPMWNEDGTVGVVFNGEIYNAGELRDQLVTSGHRFSSHHSDTEVLVHGYEQWGQDLPIRLNGMFAFAVFDAAKGQLFLARDRFGEKPLYYAKRPGVFAFASEAASLGRHPAVGFELDPRAVQKLFAYGYIPAPASALRGVSKLPAGWTLQHDCRTGATSTREYWRFRLQPDEAITDRDEPRLVEQLRELLTSSVRRRLQSDVPLGIFLSGGVDSSTVLACAAQLVPPDQISTFTVGFNEASYDESAAAASTARAFGTRHHTSRLDLQNAHTLMLDVLQRLDEPIGDASLVPTYLLCRFARQSVTVALSGDGGDELFAGYDPVRALDAARLYSRFVPPLLHRCLRSVASHIPPQSGYMRWDFRVRHALSGLSYAPQYWNPVWMAPIEPSRMGQFFEDPLPPEELYEEAIATWERSDQPDMLSRTLEFFTTLYLQNDILTKADRASMMVSLESRAVFLDNALVDFCRALPNRWKYRAGERKYLLKRALRGLVPDAVLERRKQGFSPPVQSWLCHLATPPAFGMIPGLKREAFQRRWEQHRAGKGDDRLLLWTWLALETWASQATRTNRQDVVTQ
ncbi:MAG TPA: asparagine synthase (glutamine-hydrolyzing) [Vicinamibacterales bacterium]|nr:asparagine synthase (glutamine-hydrolyzing) [Vicinamibacterales bacterium]